MIWQSSYSVQLSLLTWFAHQILIVLLVDTFKMSQVAGSSTYGIMLRSDSMIFKSCVCYYFCFSDNNFHSLLSCAKSCKWIRKNFSRDLFIVCEEHVALACNNGITAGLKLEIPFLVSLSIVCPYCGVNACHPHRPSNSCVPQCTSWRALLSLCTEKKQYRRMPRKASSSRLLDSLEFDCCKCRYMIDSTLLHHEVMLSIARCILPVIILCH